MSAELSEITIGPYEPGDEVHILAAFKKVFDVERPLEVWNWEYRDNPAGLHCFLARLPDRQVVSQFTGIPRRVRFGEREVCFSEIVDSLTDPEFRRGLKKPGLFATTCYRFVDHYGRPDREIIMYGLPNPPAFRVGRALLGYVWLYELEFLTREFLGDPGEVAAELAGGVGSAAAVEAFSSDADALEAELASASQIAVVKDATYLNWRYPARPDVGYELVEYHDAGGRLFGLAALHHQWRGLPITVACDLQVDFASSSLGAVLHDIESRAAARGCSRLKILKRPRSDAWLALQDHGYRAQPDQFTFVARTYDRENLPIDHLRDHWQIGAGDFDIC